MTAFAEGQLILVSNGAYSDYTVMNLWRVLKPFDSQVIVEAWLTLHPEQRAAYHGDFDAFGAWVLAEGYVELVEHHEWFLGSYGTFDGDLAT